MNKSKISYQLLSLFLCFLIFAGCGIDLTGPNFTPMEKQEAKRVGDLPLLNNFGTLTLYPSQDGRVFSVYPDHAADYATYFASQTWTWSGKAGSIRSLLQFNLNAIPANATVTNAQLYLYHHPDIHHAPLTSSNASYLERITQPWNAGTANWNNQPAVTTMNSVYLPESASPTQDYRVDVTRLINDMRQYGNYGMRLKLAAETRYASLYFASSNYTNSAYHPKLVVTYTGGSSERVTTTLNRLNTHIGTVERVVEVINLGPAGLMPPKVTNVSEGIVHIGGTQYSGNIWGEYITNTKAYCAFDLSSIPPSATIQSARIYTTYSWVLPYGMMYEGRQGPVLSADDFNAVTTKALLEDYLTDGGGRYTNLNAEGRIVVKKYCGGTLPLLFEVTSYKQGSATIHLSDPKLEITYTY